jgi:hypothetical protein
MRTPGQSRREESKVRRIVYGRSPYTTLRKLYFTGPTAYIEVSVQRSAVEAVIVQMESAGFQLANPSRSARHFYELKLRRRMPPAPAAQETR